MYAGTHPCVCEAREQPQMFAPQVPPRLTLAWNLTSRLSRQPRPHPAQSTGLRLPNAGVVSVCHLSWHFLCGFWGSDSGLWVSAAAIGPTPGSVLFWCRLLHLQLWWWVCLAHLTVPAAPSRADTLLLGVPMSWMAVSWRVVLSVDWSICTSQFPSFWNDSSFILGSVSFSTYFKKLWPDGHHIKCTILTIKNMIVGNIWLFTHITRSVF